MKKIMFPLFIIALIAGCGAPQGVGIGGITGFRELPFPSNAYAPGQIVEIYTKPYKKVEITYPPDIPWDRHHVSPGWDIDSEKFENVKSNLALVISKVLKGRYSYISEKNIHVQFIDTKTIIVPKNLIYSTLKNDITSDNSLKEQLTDYINIGTRFDVITMTLSGTIKVTVIDKNMNEIVVDSEMIKKLNSELKLDMQHERGTNELISGKNLVVGIHYDTEMINLIMGKI